MTSTQIHYFLAAARHNSISKAAEELYVSQPTVSRQISNLEAALQVKLFQPAGRNIELTECGKALYQLFSTFDQDFRNILNHYQTQDTSPKGKLRIGYISTWDIIPLFSAIIQRFSERYPAVSITFQSCTVQEAMSRLKQQDVDAILTMDTVLPDSDALLMRTITSIQQLILYSAAQPPHGKQTELCLEDFRDSLFYYLPQSEVPKMKDRVLEAFLNLGFTPAMEEKSTWQTCLAHVSCGNGVILTDEWAPEVQSEKFRTFPMPNRHKIAFVWRKSDKNPCIPLMKDELLRFFRQ